MVEPDPEMYRNYRDNSSANEVEMSLVGDHFHGISVGDLGQNCRVI